MEQHHGGATHKIFVQSENFFVYEYIWEKQKREEKMVDDEIP